MRDGGSPQTTADAGRDGRYHAQGPGLQRDRCDGRAASHAVRLDPPVSVPIQEPSDVESFDTLAAA